MGGCRCTFRSCMVNTMHFPGMHFFHYPLKHAERLANWIKYSNYVVLRKLSAAQARNKVVCALHFRDECFMNYKKDRLIAQAVPTLDRLRNGLVLDYSTSPNPTPMVIPSTTEKHLIPPKGYLPLGLAEDYFNDGSAHVEVLDEVVEEEAPESPPTKRLKPAKSTRTPKILNKGVRSPSPTSISRHLGDEEVFEAFDDELGLMLSENGASCETLSTTAVVSADGEINLSELEFLPAEKEDEEETECVDEGTLISREMFNQTVEAFENEITELKNDYDKKIREAQERVACLEAELAEARVNAELALASAEAAKSSANDAKKKLESVEAANLKLNRAAAAVAVAPKQKPTGTGFGQLTKPLLFNGIKKYVSASMTALVRMEMFGGTERQWKPDEKQVSVELLRLGEKVYEYFSDEWRFRLPPKKLVQEWTHQVNDEDEEDL